MVVFIDFLGSTEGIKAEAWINAMFFLSVHCEEGASLGHAYLQVSADASETLADGIEAFSADGGGHNLE